MIKKEWGCGKERARLWYGKSEVVVQKERGCGKERVGLW